MGCQVLPVKWVAQMVYPTDTSLRRRQRAFRMPKFDHRNRSFRVELRTDQTRVLDRVEGVFPQFRTLDPYASRLIQDGEEGELLLIDEATDKIVARKLVKPRV
jgi:hypothetical protein